MSFKWITDDGDRIIAIVGISKNAGKTTLLNHLLKKFPNSGFAVFSTGIDGEETDAVYKTPKPSVQLPSHSIFCCDAATLNVHSGSVEILASFPSPQRQLWIARSLFEINTSITGPATVSAQIKLSRAMLDLGAQKVIIDGSLDRKSISLSPGIDAVILVMGASFGSVDVVEKELQRLLFLSHIPPADDLEILYPLLIDSEELMGLDAKSWIPSGLPSLAARQDEAVRFFKSLPDLQAIYLPGAITPLSLNAFLSALPPRPIRLILRHPDCLKLSLLQLQQLNAKTSLFSLIPFKIKAVALNSEAVGSSGEDASIFRSRLRSRFADLDFIDIMELQNA